MSSQNQCKVHPREIERAVNSSCKDAFKYICFVVYRLSYCEWRKERRWRLSNWGLCFWTVILKTFPSPSVCRLTEEGEMRLIKVKSRIPKNSG